MAVAHVSPEADRLAVVAEHAADDESPVVMLNLNRYRARAAYPEGYSGDDADVSGREAYLRYGMVAAQAVASVGGHILWGAPAAEVVIGCEHDRYDEVLAVWYPSRSAFLRLGEFPGYLESHVHRDAALEQAALLATRGGPTPELTSPFAG